MSSWDIVVFLKDNTSEYVPTSWAVTAQKNLYLWPKKLSPNQVKKLRDNCTEPTSNIEYDEWAATCKATVYDINEAQKLADRATYTSNLSSGGEERHGEYDEKVSSEGESEESNDDLTSKGETRGRASQSDTVNTPKRFRYKRAESSTTPVQLKGATQVLNSSNNSLNSKHLSVVDKKDGPFEIVKELNKMTKALTGVKHDISEIKKDIHEINMKLNVLSDNTTKKKFHNFSKFNLPLTTQIQLDELEERIQDPSSDDFQDLVDLLSHVGGLTSKKNILFIMKKLLNRELSLQYSAHGKKQKKSFLKLNLYKAVLEAAKVNFKSSDLEITQFIGLALATAADRDGGRNNRKPVGNPE